MSVALYMGARKMAEGTTGGANDTGPCVVFSCWALWPRSKVPSSKAQRTGTTSTTGMSLSSHPVLYSQGIFPLPSSRAARCLQLLICTRMFVFFLEIGKSFEKQFFLISLRIFGSSHFELVLFFSNLFYSLQTSRHKEKCGN